VGWATKANPKIIAINGPETILDEVKNQLTKNPLIITSKAGKKLLLEAFNNELLPFLNLESENIFVLIHKNLMKGQKALSAPIGFYPR